MKEIQAFKCDHCGKLYRFGGTAINHEKICRKNPQNIAACGSCMYIEEIAIQVKNRSFCGDPYDNAPIYVPSRKFHCNKLNKDVYPAIVLRKKLHLRYPEQFKNQEQMPSNCEFCTREVFNYD